MPTQHARNAASAEEHWPSPMRRGLLLALLLALYTLSFIDRTILVLLIEPLKRDLSLSDVEVSLLVGMAFSVFYAAAGVPLGYVADVWNRRNLIAAGVTFWSLMTATGGLAGSFITLFLSRMGVGFGEAALSPAAYSVLADSYPRDRLSRALAIYTFGASLGSGLALTIGALLLQFIESDVFASVPAFADIKPWRMALMLAAVPGLLMAILVMGLAEPARRAPAANATAGEFNGAFAFIRANGALIYPLFLGVALHSAVMYGANTWLPTFFVRTFDIPASSAAVPVGIIQAVFGTLGMLLGAVWSDRKVASGSMNAHMETLFWGMAIGGGFFLLAPLAPTPGLAYAAIAVAFTFGMFQGGIVPAGLQLVTPPHLRGRMIALYLMTMNLVGFGLGPTFVALATTHLFGESSIKFALAATALALSPAATFLIYRTAAPFRRLYAGMRP